ncbi:MAG: putative ABC transporter permease subunit [Acholeplasmataceae bacterium]
MYAKLVKLFLKENFSLKRILGFDYRTSRVKAVLIGLAIVYALIVFIGTFGYMFFDLGKILMEMGQPQLLLSFLGVYAIGLSALIVFLRANGSLFFYKDYEILSPLPLHPRTVLAARMTTLLIMLYAAIAVFTLPIAFAYFYWNGVEAIALFFYLLAFPFIPLVPVVLMSSLALGIAVMTRRFRKSNLLNIVFMFAVVIALFLASFSVNEATVNPLTGQIDLFAGLSELYPPLRWFTDAVSKGSLIDLILIVLSHAGLFFLFIYLIEGAVQKTNQKGRHAQTRKREGPITYRAKGVIPALIQKEIRKFFSTPIYALNTGLGPVLLLILSVGSLFYRSEIEGFLAETVGLGPRIEAIILVLIGFSTAMTYTSAISLSLEGKNFWIVKSLPLEAKRVMAAKVAFNLVLIVPVAILSVILFGFSLAIAPVVQAIMILLSGVFALLISVMDAVVNLYFPKFEFASEVEVIKQSIAALIAVFGGFLVLIANGLIYVLLDDHASFETLLVLLTLFDLLLLLPFVYVLQRKSETRFRRMKA